MKIWIILIALVVLVTFVAIAGVALFLVLRQPASKKVNYVVGGLYSVRGDGDSSFMVAKILAIEDKGVHIRLYKQSWPVRPESVKVEELSLGRFDEPGDAGIGHLPLSLAAFARLLPQFIQSSTVKPEELDGYEMWKDGGGTFF